MKAWTGRALAALDVAIDIDEKVTGEDIRLSIGSLVGNPHHVNVWGRFIRTAVAQGKLLPTDEFRPAQIAKSRGALLPVYQIGG